MKRLTTAVEGAIAREVTTFATCWRIAFANRRPRISRIIAGRQTIVETREGHGLREGDYCALSDVYGFKPVYGALGLTGNLDGWSFVNDDANAIGRWRNYLVTAVLSPYAVAIGYNSAAIPHSERVGDSGTIRRVRGYTDFADPLVVDGMVYRTTAGYELTAVETAAGGQVDTTAVQGVLPPRDRGDDVNERDLLAGAFDFAELRVFRIDWTDPAAGKIVLRRGYLGEVSVGEHQYDAEVRSLAEVLQQPILDVYSPECRHRFGDARCGVMPNSQQVRVQADSQGDDIVADVYRPDDRDTLAYGTLTWLTGENAGTALPIVDADTELGEAARTYRPLELPAPGAPVQDRAEFVSRLLSSVKAAANAAVHVPLAEALTVPRIAYMPLPSSFDYLHPDVIPFTVGFGSDLSRYLVRFDGGPNPPELVPGGVFVLEVIATADDQTAPLALVVEGAREPLPVVFRPTALVRPPEPGTGTLIDDTNRNALTAEQDIFDVAPFRYRSDIDGRLQRIASEARAVTHAVTMGEAEAARLAGRPFILLKYHPDGTCDALSEFVRRVCELPLIVNHADIADLRTARALPPPPKPTHPGPLATVLPPPPVPGGVVPYRVPVYDSVPARVVVHQYGYADLSVIEGPSGDPVSLLDDTAEPWQVVIVDLTGAATGTDSTGKTLNDLQSTAQGVRWFNINSQMYHNGFLRPDYPPGSYPTTGNGWTAQHVLDFVAAGKPFTAWRWRGSFPVIVAGPAATAEELQDYILSPLHPDTPAPYSAPPRWTWATDGGRSAAVYTDDAVYDAVAALPLYGTFDTAGREYGPNAQAQADGTDTYMRFRHSDGRVADYDFDFLSGMADVFNWGGYTLSSLALQGTTDRRTLRVLEHPTATTRGRLQVLDVQHRVLAQRHMRAPPELRDAVRASFNPVQSDGATPDELDDYARAAAYYARVTGEGDTAGAFEPPTLILAPDRTDTLVPSTAGYNAELLQSIARAEVFALAVLRFDRAYRPPMAIEITDEAGGVYRYALRYPWNGEHVSSERDGHVFRIDRQTTGGSLGGGILQILDDRVPAGAGAATGETPEDPGPLGSGANVAPYGLHQSRLYNGRVDIMLPNGHDPGTDGLDDIVDIVWPDTSGEPPTSTAKVNAIASSPEANYFGGNIVGIKDDANTSLLWGDPRLAPGSIVRIHVRSGTSLYIGTDLYDEGTTQADIDAYQDALALAGTESQYANPAPEGFGFPDLQSVEPGPAPTLDDTGGEVTIFTFNADPIGDPPQQVEFVDVRAPYDPDAPRAVRPLVVAAGTEEGGEGPHESRYVEIIASAGYLHFALDVAEAEDHGVQANIEREVDADDDYRREPCVLLRAQVGVGAVMVSLTDDFAQLEIADVFYYPNDEGVTRFVRARVALGGALGDADRIVLRAYVSGADVYAEAQGYQRSVIRSARARTALLSGRPGIGTFVSEF